MVDIYCVILIFLKHSLFFSYKSSISLQFFFATAEAREIYYWKALEMPLANRVTKGKKDPLFEQEKERSTVGGADLCQRWWSPGHGRGRRRWWSSGLYWWNRDVEAM
jgi:hypothetical protein